MPFIHEDAEFDDLLRIVADRRGLQVGLVEKDYWVTHTLWAILSQGFDLWFKGGTSLSKGFGIIERFSEDLDLKIEPGTISALPAVTDWVREGASVTEERRLYFDRLVDLLHVPGADASLAHEFVDRSWRNAGIRVVYPGRHLASLGPLRPFVLLEVGEARVTPFVARDLSSFVHDYLVEAGQLDTFEDNRPRAVRLVHPLVTLIEKLDALQRRVPNATVQPATFVRHFEDAARIIAAAAGLPPLAGYADPAALAADMRSERQIRAIPVPDDPVFVPIDSPRWRTIRAAHDAIALMFWGERIDLDTACRTIREWVGRSLSQ